MGLGGAAVVALVWAMAPDDEGTCSPDPCEGVDAVVGLAPRVDVAVPIDGVLVLQANWFGELDADALLAGLAWTVTQGGEEVDGALAATDVEGALVWRPAAPLRPGATYRADGVITNPATVPAVCAAPAVEVSWTFTAADGPAEAVAEPRFSGLPLRELEPRYDLEALACCDGAYPRALAICGVEHRPVWAAGQCAPRTGRVVETVWFRALIDADEVTASQWVRTLIRDGVRESSTFADEFTVPRGEAPACFRLELRDLASGQALISDEACVAGAVHLEEEHAIDPRPLLAEACAGAMYTCEVVGDRWDADACAPYELGPAAPEPFTEVEAIGCACGAAGGSTWWLGLVPLVRRRRVRRG